MYVYLKQNIFLDLFYRILRSVLEHLKTCLDNCNNIIVSYLFVCLELASDFQYLSIEVHFFHYPERKKKKVTSPADIEVFIASSTLQTPLHSEHHHSRPNLLKRHH